MRRSDGFAYLPVFVARIFHTCDRPEAGENYHVQNVSLTLFL